MKKTYQRLPESELDIMLVLWNNMPPMSRMEIEKVINAKKSLAPEIYTGTVTGNSDGSSACRRKSGIVRVSRGSGRNWKSMNSRAAAAPLM